MSEATFAHGQRVTVAGRLGTVRFCGGTQFAAGVWVGIELDDAVGKNSGTVQDIEYFRCPPEHGIFVRPPMVQILEGEATSSKGAESPKQRFASTSGAESPKPRASTASGAAGAGAESPKPRASTASGAAGAESPKPRASTASGAAGAESPKPRASTASGAAGGSPVGSEVPDAQEKAETKEAAEIGGAEEKAAAETAVAAEKAAEEAAAAETAAAEKAAAEKAAAEKAAAEKAEAEKAAAEKAAVEKAAVEKAAAEKAAAEKAAAEKAAAEKAAAEKEAAEKAALEKAAAEKAAAAEQAERTAQDQAKKAQEASAAQLAASKAQSAAEADLRSARQEVTRLKNDIERAKSGMVAERERLAQMKWKREQALQQMEKLAKIEYGDVEHSEEVLQAQAEMKRAAEAAEKLRSELNQKKNNVSTMMMIRSKLKKKVENVQDQSQLQAMLQEKLDASILGRLMAEERLEELKLELAEAELKRDEEAEEKAKLLVQMVNIPTPAKGEVAASEDGAMAALMKLQNRKNRKEEAPAPAAPETPAAAPPNITRSPELDAYQEALRVLHQACQLEVDEMQKHIAVLDRDSNKVPRLKTDQRTLTNRQNLLQERMADLETEAHELEETAKVGDDLRDLRDSFVQELQKEVDQREERLHQLEDLVLKLDKERQRLQEEADRDASDAQDLFQEVMKLTDGSGHVQGQGTDEVHVRLAEGSVQLRMARLDLATAKAKAAAFADCVPLTWQEHAEAPSSASESLALALAVGGVAKACERLLFRLEGLGRQASTSGQQGKLRLEMCEVACVALRCAASLASLLDAGLVEEDTSIEAMKKLEEQFKRLEQKMKELMHKKWPLDSPSQALNCLQEIETLTGQVMATRTLSTRGLSYQMQRFQVAFAYGIASKSSKESDAKVATDKTPKPPEAKEDQEDGAMAALMRLQNRNKKPEETPAEAPLEAAEASENAEAPKTPEEFQQEMWPEIQRRLKVAQQTGASGVTESELQRLGKAIEVGLGKCATGEEEEPTSFWRALKAATDYWSLLPPSEARMDLLKTETLALLRRSNAWVSSEAPAWAASSLEVQSRVDEIDEKQREVREAQEQLKEKKKLLTLREEEMLKAEDRGKELKAKLSAMIEANQTSDTLQAEEEKLRQEVAAKASYQAQLVQQCEEAKAKRDKLEELHKEEERKRKQLEESIDRMRQRPKQDEDGRATAPEFAALRVSQKKGARELYALQVAGMQDLVPLPGSQERASKTEECLEKYSTLRKSLLRHLSSARIQRLGVRDPAEEVFNLRLQELHFQLSAARLQVLQVGEKELSPPKATLEGKPGDPALSMALRLQAPRWTSCLKMPKELHSSNWSDIREIHVAAA